MKQSLTRTRFGLSLPLLSVIAIVAGTGVLGSRQPDRSIQDLGREFGEKAVTKPSRDAVMGFTFSTEVREILVQNGDEVKQGQLLIRARDGEAVAAMKLQTMRVENTYEVQAAENALELAQLDWDRVKNAFEEGGSTTGERDRAQNALRAAEIQAAAAQERLAEQSVQLERLTAEVERFRLMAPFDGIVENVLVDVGHAARESDPAVRVVQIDPLWIDVPADAKETLVLGIQVGDPAWVLMDLPGKLEVRKGEVISIGSVADAASGSRRVRVEVPNPDRVPAGLTSWVRFRKPTGQWNAKVATSEGGAPS